MKTRITALIQLSIHIPILAMFLITWLAAFAVSALLTLFRPANDLGEPANWARRLEIISTPYRTLARK
jgi:hypothetical protein